jgi:hypothetical protein
MAYNNNNNNNNTCNNTENNNNKLILKFNKLLKHLPTAKKKMRQASKIHKQELKGGKYSN